MAFGFEEIRAPRYSLDGKVLLPTRGELPPFRFEPRGQLINDKYKRISGVPGHPELLLRWTSDRWIKVTDNLVYDVQDRIKISQNHHEQLSAFGIKIPRYVHAAMGKAPDQEAVALYTLVERLNLTPWTNIPIETRDQLIESLIVEPMLDYYDWLDSTQQPYQLQDLGMFTQFGLVANAESEAGYDAYLLDIECLVAPRS